MAQPSKVLQIEDSERDASLIQSHLKRANFEFTCRLVNTAEELQRALADEDWDLILSDYSLPGFNAVNALEIVHEADLDLPFIIISGTISEATAIAAMRAGANDYFFKDDLASLLPTIKRELKNAEERRVNRNALEQLRLQSAALEAAANTIMITDQRGVIIWVNEAFTRSSGYTSEEAIGKTPRLLKSGRQAREFYKEMWDTILAGKVWRNVLVNRCKEGSLIQEELTITPILDSSNRISHFIGIKQDLTEISRTREDLQVANARLQEALKALETKSAELSGMTQQLWQASKLATMGELAASIAHELNNPLATLALRAEFLKDQLPQEDLKQKAIDVISQEIDRMATLVKNLLQFSRSAPAQRSTLNICDELNSSIELIDYHLRSRSIEIVRQFSSVPCCQADRSQLRQVFLNLLTNASDAMPNGGKLYLRTLFEADRGIIIEFEDMGIGMPAENLQNIWEPFFTTKPEGKGTGLGLAICRRAIDHHDGKIEIHSELHKGTTVRITLPANNNITNGKPGPDT